MARKPSRELMEKFNGAYELIKTVREENIDQKLLELTKILSNHGDILGCSLPDSDRSLFHAAASKNPRIIKTLIAASLVAHGDKSILQQQDSAGSSPLMEAAASNNFQVVEALLKQGAPVDSIDDDGNSALHHACKIDALESVKLLDQFKANFQKFNVAREKPIHVAAGSNSAKVLEYILTNVKGVDINEKMMKLTMEGEEADSDQEDDSEELTPLCCAAKEGHVQAINVLLTASPPANPLEMCMATDDFTVAKEERTALMIAARRNHKNACEALLKVKTKEQLMAYDKDNTKPLAYASVSGDKNLMRLITGTSKAFMPDDATTEALRMAANFGNFDAFVNLQNTFPALAEKHKETLLRDAVSGGSTEVVTWALKNLHCDPNQKDPEMWETAVHRAAIYGNANLLQLLLRHGGDVKAMNRDKQTPLSLASQQGNFQVVKVLLEHGADPTRKVKLDDAWHSSLEIAIKCGSTDSALAMINKYKAQIPNAEAGVRTRKPPMWYRLTTRRAFHTAAKSMPRAASAMLDWRIMQYGSMSAPVFTLVLGFELLEDGYIIIPKNKTEGKSNIEIYYEQSQETPWQDMPQEEQKEGEPEKITPWMGEPLGMRDKAVPFSDNLRKREELNVIKMMVDNDQEELLLHPVVLSYLKTKWDKFAKYVYYSLFLLYLLFVILLTLYVCLQKPPYPTGDELNQGSQNSTQQPQTSNLEEAAGYIRYIAIIVILFNYLVELLQLMLRKMQYIVQGSNYLDWFIYLAGLFFLVPLGEDKTITEIQWYVGSVVVGCAWFRLLMFVQQMPAFGIYVVMFFVVLRSFATFAVVYMLFLLGFAVTFFMLMRDINLFGNFITLLLKIIVMTIGELDYGNLFGDEKEKMSSRPEWATHLLSVVYLFFVIIMTVVIMNLLVGIAVQDIREVYNIAQLKKQQMMAGLILDSEMMLPESVRRKFIVRGKPLYVKEKGQPAKVITDGDNPNPMSDDGILYAFMQGQKKKAGHEHPEEQEEDPLARRRIETITKAEERVIKEGRTDRSDRL